MSDGRPAAAPTAAVVIRSGGLGDFILTLPLLHALHRARRELRLITRDSYAELARRTGWVDACESLDGPAASSLFTEPTPALRALLRDVDLFCFWPDRDGTLLRAARACGARAVRFLCARPSTPPHVTLRMLAAAGFDADRHVLDTSWLERPEGPGDGAREALWLHPGSGSGGKNAPLEAYARLARAWRGPVAVTLGEAERSERERYADAFPAAEQVWLPSLATLHARLAAEAAVFVGNDTGPTHLAAALGIPTAAVYVRTDPRIWRPLGTRVATVTPADLGSLYARQLVELGDGSRSGSS